MDLSGSLRGFGFVDCGIVWRSSLVRRVIGRMYRLWYCLEELVGTESDWEDV